MRITGYGKIWTVTLATLAGVFVFIPGCEPEFDMTRGTTLGNNIPARQMWKVTDTGGGLRNTSRAIDGNMSTIAISGRRYRNASFTLDLGRSCIFNLLALRHGMNEFGFARRVSLSTSLDGKKYTKRYECIGTRRVTYIPILTPITARYLRITATVPGREPWAIAEIYLQ